MESILNEMESYEESLNNGKDYANRIQYMKKDRTFIEEIFRRTLLLIREAINLLTSTMRNLYTDIKYKARKHSRKDSIKKSISYLERLILKKVPKIRVFDCWSYCDAITDAAESMWKYADRFMRAKYPDLQSMKHDIEIMDKMIATYQRTIPEFLEKTKYVGTVEYHRFLMNELNGKSVIYDTIDFAIKIIENMNTLLNRQITTYNNLENTEMLRARATFTQNCTTCLKNMGMDATRAVKKLIISPDS